MEEIWKPVVGYEGLYEVSNLGRVKSIKRNKIMKFKFDCGYLRIGLRNGCNQKFFPIHRLVLIAFVGLPQNGQECDHVNRNRTDNRIENLRWVTRSKNQLNKKTYGQSKYKGVTYRVYKYKKKNGEISVQITIKAAISYNKKHFNLGYFKTEEEAHEAYKQAFKKYYGYDYIN